MFAKRSINTILQKASLFNRVATPAFRAAALNQQVYMSQMSSMIKTQQKAFSTNYDAIEKATQKINRALESEIKYENENYTQLEDIETFLNDSGFTFSEADDKIHMYLTKDVGDKHVEVAFEAR